MTSLSSSGASGNTVMLARITVDDTQFVSVEETHVPVSGGTVIPFPLKVNVAPG